MTALDWTILSSEKNTHRTTFICLLAAMTFEAAIPIGPFGHHIAVFVKATLNGGTYANKWIEQDRRLLYYLKAIKGKFDEDYQDNRSIIEHPDVPVYVFVRHSRRESFIVEAYARNPDVVAEVLVRASGACEGCQQPVPFVRRKDATPYLEVHHKVPLSLAGDDTVANAIALCPNCHRQEHYGPARWPVTDQDLPTEIEET